MRRAVPTVLLAIAMGIGGAWGAPEPAEPAPEGAHVVRYRDDKVSVDLHDTSITTAMHDLARASGAELVGAARDDHRVTLSFEDIPLKEALERLVGAQNFTLKYDDAGKLKAIELRGGQEARQTPKGPTELPSENTTPPKQYAFFKAFDRGDLVPITGELRKVLGRDEVGWDYLGNTAIANPDPRVRQAALRALMNALDRDPEMRAAVLDSLNAMSSDELAAFVRARCYHMAEGLVRNVLRESSDPEVRSRARDVLRGLRSIPFKGPKPQMH